MSLATICSTEPWKDNDMRKILVAILVLLGALQIARADEQRPWAEIVSAAHGQTVYWNAWAGDQRIRTSYGIRFYRRGVAT